MNWSLSEYLNLVELRSQSWCFVNLSRGNGVHFGHGDVMFFHAVLEGTVRLASGGGQTVELGAGDIAMVISGDAHAMRNHHEGPSTMVELLRSGEPLDAPSVLKFGEGPIVTKLLSGRIKVRWPGGSLQNRLPPLLLVRADESAINFDRFIEEASQPGATALLTRAATLLFVSAFIRHPRCQALFRLNLDDPIARAKVLIDKHPFQPWTVESLARKVGMGRSNFAARFTAEIGKTPIDVLTEARMKHAEHFLQNTDLKIVEVGERVGYRSAGAFIRRFTTHFGITPGKLRRQSGTLH